MEKLKEKVLRFFIDYGDEDESEAVFEPWTFLNKIAACYKVDFVIYIGLKYLGL
ncbi:hypothetical protein ROU88_08075 [Macrococcus capreoli]